MDAYYPKDDLSKQLLASIPRKVYLWLVHLSGEKIRNEHGEFEATGELSTKVGNFGRLSWDFAGEQQCIIIEEDETGTEETVRIWWCEKAFNPTFVCGTEKWMEDISSNLDQFIQLERRIYDQIEALAVMIDERNMGDALERNLPSQKAGSV